ncbi:MAG TPA: metal-sensitive transcriptional regulator [Actinomycetota bacterium]|nr:metal-sensitive transcriptional regulator [Actinomycetota bacterium]
MEREGVHMYGYYQDKPEVQARLKRVEGQIRGLQRLVDEDTYCVDILTQISAVNAALRKVAVQLLDDHIRHCVAESVTGGTDPESKISEATAAIDRLLKS